MTEIFEILTDPAHWVAEIVMDGTITLALLWPARIWLRRHDRKAHSLALPEPHYFAPILIYDAKTGSSRIVDRCGNCDRKAHP